MSNLVKHENFIVSNEKISKMSKDVYLANQQIPLSVIEDKNVVVNNIHTYINRTIMDKGINLETKEINYIKTSVVDDIMREFPNLSLEDVKLAFYLGVRGEFGEYYGLNTITFYNWLKHYKSQLLPKAYSEVYPLLPKNEVVQEVKVDRRIVESEMAKTICEVYFNLCVFGIYEFNDIGNIHFKFLQRNNMVFLSDEDEKELFEQAKLNVTNDLVNRNMRKANQGKELHRIKISDAVREIENGDENSSYFNEVLIEKMKLSFYKVLYMYATEDYDIYELLKHKIV